MGATNFPTPAIAPTEGINRTLTFESMYRENIDGIADAKMLYPNMVIDSPATKNMPEFVGGIDPCFNASEAPIMNACPTIEMSNAKSERRT